MSETVPSFHNIDQEDVLRESTHLKYVQPLPVCPEYKLPALEVLKHLQAPRIYLNILLSRSFSQAEKIALIIAMVVNILLNFRD
jgi:hypothetical protein